MVTNTLNVKLQETPTLIFYQQDNESVDTREEDHENEVQKWKTYCEKKEKRSVKMMDIECQTVPKYNFDKCTQKLPTEYKDSATLVTLWDMYDELQKMEMKETHSEAEEQPIPKYERVQQEFFKGNAPNGAKSIPVTNLMIALGWIERSLSCSDHLSDILLFAGERDLVAERRKLSLAAHKTKIETLWTFESNNCKGIPINSICLFVSTPWLLLAGCGNLKFKETGLILGWNIKKLTEPEIRYERKSRGTIVSNGTLIFIQTMRCISIELMDKRRIETPSPVTTVCTSPKTPQLCAAAMLDGSIRVYQLDLPNYPIILDTWGSPEKHFGPVWCIRWSDQQLVHSSSKKESKASFRKLISTIKGSPSHPVELADVIVTASEDGLVKEWVFTRSGGLITSCILLRVRLPTWLSLSIAGGLDEVLDFNEEDLTKNTTENPQSSQTTAKKSPRKLGSDCICLPETVPATCISFQPGNKTVYILGTVSGHVLLCRSFERNQVQQVFQGHTAHVCNVAWRMTTDDSAKIFLSASLDETIRVWHINKPNASLCVLKMPKAGAIGYIDAEWCLWYSNLIVGVHSEGIHLWDISLSSQAPVISMDIKDSTCTAFSPHTRNIFVGDADGTIHTIHLEGLEESASLFYKYASGLTKLAKLSIADD